MTPKQCIAARRLLGYTQQRLAQALSMQQADISRFENTGYMARAQDENLSRVVKLKGFFEAAGVEFTNGHEPAVKLRRAERLSSSQGAASKLRTVAW